MTEPNHFEAPWSTSLKFLTAIGVTVLAIASGAIAVLLPLPAGVRLLIAAALLSILPGCGFFAVRGYVIEPDSLRVLRPCWTTSISLRHLVDAEAQRLPKGFMVRLCGNGGLFAFTGWFWSRALGSFRLFGTDLSRTVILRFDRSIVVVTPDRPVEFVQQLAANRSLASARRAS